MTTLAQAKDYISVWVSQGDFGALGICNCAPDCDDSIHVLFSLRLDVVHKLWKMGRGRTQSGAPRLAPDGRLVLAPGGAAAIASIFLLPALHNYMHQPATDDIEREAVLNQEHELATDDLEREAVLNHEHMNAFRRVRNSFSSAFAGITENQDEISTNEPNISQYITSKFIYENTSVAIMWKFSNYLKFIGMNRPEIYDSDTIKRDIDRMLSENLLQAKLIFRTIPWTRNIIEPCPSKPPLDLSLQWNPSARDSSRNSLDFDFLKFHKGLESTAGDDTCVNEIQESSQSMFLKAWNAWQTIFNVEDIMANTNDAGSQVVNSIESTSPPGLWRHFSDTYVPLDNTPSKLCFKKLTTSSGSITTSTYSIFDMNGDALSRNLKFKKLAEAITRNVNNNFNTRVEVIKQFAQLLIDNKKYEHRLEYTIIKILEEYSGRHVFIDGEECSTMKEDVFKGIVSLGRGGEISSSEFLNLQRKVIAMNINATDVETLTVLMTGISMTSYLIWVGQHSIAALENGQYHATKQAMGAYNDDAIIEEKKKGKKKEHTPRTDVDYIGWMMFFRYLITKGAEFCVIGAITLSTAYYGFFSNTMSWIAGMGCIYIVLELKSIVGITDLAIKSYNYGISLAAAKYVGKLIVSIREDRFVPRRNAKYRFATSFGKESPTNDTLCNKLYQEQHAVQLFYEKTAYKLYKTLRYSEEIVLNKIDKLGTELSELIVAQVDTTGPKRRKLLFDMEPLVYQLLALENTFQMFKIQRDTLNNIDKQWTSFFAEQLTALKTYNDRLSMFSGKKSRKDAEDEFLTAINGLKSRYFIDQNSSQFHVVTAIDQNSSQNMIERHDSDHQIPIDQRTYNAIVRVLDSKRKFETDLQLHDRDRHPPTAKPGKEFFNEKLFFEIIRERRIVIKGEYIRNLATRQQVAFQKVSERREATRSTDLAHETMLDVDALCEYAESLIGDLVDDGIINREAAEAAATVLRTNDERVVL